MRPLITVAPAVGESWTRTVIYDFLPSFAVAAGLLAVIWLACTIIATAGACLGVLVFHAARLLIRACLRPVRRRWSAEYARLVTVDADGVTARPVPVRRMRRWCEHPPRTDTPAG